MDNFITELIKMKTKFINILLFFFILLLLLTISTVVIYYLFIIFLYEWEDPEKAQTIINFYDVYLRKVIILESLPCFDQAPKSFDFFFKFPFETVIFFFSFLSVILLTFIKYRTFNYNLKLDIKNILLYTIFILCLFFILFYNKGYYSFFNIINYYNHEEFRHIFQFFIYFIFILSFIFYLFINFLIINEKELNFISKLLFIILITYILYLLSFSACSFLHISVNYTGIVPLEYMSKLYNIPFVECMNDAQPKNSYDDCLRQHKVMSKECKNFMITRDPDTKAKCDLALAILNSECKEILTKRK